MSLQQCQSERENCQRSKPGGACIWSVITTTRRADAPARRRLSLLAALVALTGLFDLAHPRPASAQCDTASSTCTWNAGTGSWFTGTNWTTSPGPPTSTSTVTVNNGGIANIDTGTATSSNTTIDNSSGVVVDSGRSWTNAGSSPGFNERGGAIIVGETGTGGSLTINNGGTVTTTGANGAHVGTVLVGDQAGSSGSITLGNGTAGTATLTSTASGRPISMSAIKAPAR